MRCNAIIRGRDRAHIRLSSAQINRSDLSTPSDGTPTSGTLAPDLPETRWSTEAWCVVRVEFKRCRVVQLTNPC